MKYAAIHEDSNNVETPFFDSRAAVTSWLRDNDPDGLQDKCYTVVAFTEDQVIEMGKLPEA
jgi:hypothetical protein